MFAYAARWTTGSRAVAGTLAGVSATGRTSGAAGESAATTTVLVVEDDATLCYALEQGLLPEGFDVVVATDATEGFELAAEIDPGLVLLDWVLPEGLGGPPTCQRMCAAEAALAVTTVAP
jgi:two-component system nitrogen regulation response regulator GlnG